MPTLPEVSMRTRSRLFVMKYIGWFELVPSLSSLAAKYAHALRVPLLLVNRHAPDRVLSPLPPVIFKVEILSPGADGLAVPIPTLPAAVMRIFSCKVPPVPKLMYPVAVLPSRVVAPLLSQYKAPVFTPE